MCAGLKNASNRAKNSPICEDFAFVFIVRPASLRPRLGAQWRVVVHNGIVNGEHMRKRFAPPRRRRVSSSAPADLEKSESLDNLALTEALEASEAFEAPRCGAPWHGTHGLKQIALDLWAPDYSVLFEAEYAYNSLACGSGGYDLLPST